MKIDLQALTLNELATVEDKTGLPFTEALNGKSMSIRTIQALAYVTMRRTDDSVEWDDVGSMTMADITLEGDEDPTGAAN